VVAMELRLGAEGDRGVRHAEHCYRGIAEKDELAAGAKKAGSLGNPVVRIATDAGAVFGEEQVEAGIGEWGKFSIGVNEREMEVVFALKRARGLELAGGVIQADDASAEAGEPGGEVGGAAAEFQDISVGDIG